MRSFLIVAALLLILTSGCAAVVRAPHCETRSVNVRWTDGTVTTWVLTVCDRSN